MVTMKRFIDIENLRESAVASENAVSRKGNDAGFHRGDLITITEKFDGSCASIQYDAETCTLAAFSRRQPLSFSSTLEGFWNYVQTLNPETFKPFANYAIFGEWGRHNKITYNAEAMQHWYVFSAYNFNTQSWATPDVVQWLCRVLNLECIHELYNGPFISWEHCRTFCHSPAYGDTQEGIVVRNVSQLFRLTNKEENAEFDSYILKAPHILKIVNSEFKETMAVKNKTPKDNSARASAELLMSSIVTQRRVEKELNRMQEDGIIPNELTPQDIKTIAQNLPKRIYADCMKEEPETMEACGEYASKLCSSISMSIVRSLVA